MTRHSVCIMVLDGKIGAGT